MKLVTNFHVKIWEKVLVTNYRLQVDLLRQRVQPLQAHKLSPLSYSSPSPFKKQVSSFKRGNTYGVF
jgi:hypothetical protein